MKFEYQVDVELWSEFAKIITPIVYSCANDRSTHDDISNHIADFADCMMREYYKRIGKEVEE